MKVPISDLAKKVGVVRNEVLVFSIVIFAVINLFNSYEFLNSSDRLYHVAGFVIMCVSLLFPIFALIFYIYAFFRLPTSTQEYVFAKAGEKQVHEHKQIQKAAKIAPEDSGPRGEYDR